MNRTFHVLLIAVFLGSFASALIASRAVAGSNQVDWSSAKKGKGRWKVAKSKQAVLDKNTGLVWELMPGDTDGDMDVDANDEVVWGGASGAIRYCANKVVAGQMGWKVPSFDQLTTLLDLTSTSCAANQACLPDGHPFVGVVTEDYWAANTNAEASANAWVVQFGDPTQAPQRAVTVVSTAKTDTNYVWCVRTPLSGPSDY